MTPNGREIASAVWFGVVAVWALRKPGIRSSAWSAVKLAVKPKILMPGLLLLVYAVGVVWLLWRLGLWTKSLTLDTAIWFAVAGLPLPFRFITIRGEESPLKKLLAESFTALVIVEFLVGTYTFHWGVELLLVPAITFVVLLHEVGLHYYEGQPVIRVLGWARLMVILFVFGSACMMAFNDLGTLQSWDTLRQVLLAPAMSLIIVPFTLAFGVYAEYDERRIREQGGT